MRYCKRGREWWNHDGMAHLRRIDEEQMARQAHARIAQEGLPTNRVASHSQLPAHARCADKSICARMRARVHLHTSSELFRLVEVEWTLGVEREQIDWQRAPDESPQHRADPDVVQNAMVARLPTWVSERESKDKPGLCQQNVRHRFAVMTSMYARTPVVL